MPDTLRVIERPQWARVQEQLQKNISFSPRHEKHSYLLKSLVQCAGCGRRYVGDPGHGHFSYRCIARCKLCPAITEDILNDSVWNAIEAAILNPEVILQQMEGIRQKDKQNDDDNQLESRQVEHQLKQLQTEESRLLEAYRLGVINALQLGSELEKVAGKKRSLEDRKQQFASQDAIAPSQIRKSIVDYCREAASNIRAFTHAEKQKFLRTIVRNIVFDGTQARIQAEIPFGAQTRSNREGEYTETTDDEAHGRIATTIVNLRDRNPAIRTHFELTAEIPPIELFVDKRGRFCKREEGVNSNLRKITQPRQRAA